MADTEPYFCGDDKCWCADTPTGTRNHIPQVTEASPPMADVVVTQEDREAASELLRALDVPRSESDIQAAAFALARHRAQALEEAAAWLRKMGYHSVAELIPSITEAPKP